MSSLQSDAKSGKIPRIERLKDGRGLARCARCGSVLTVVMDNFTPPYIDPQGYRFDYASNLIGCHDGVWRPSEHRIKQHRRDHSLLTSGKANSSDRSRLRHGAHGQQSDADHRYDPFVFPGEPIVDNEVFGKRRLPVRIVCVECEEENRIDPNECR